MTHSADRGVSILTFFARNTDGRNQSCHHQPALSRWRNDLAFGIRFSL
jgi:hypothetical protein